MRPFKYLPTIAVAVVTVSCLAASTFAATPRQATASAARLPAAAYIVPAQSADAYGACYTWLRITPWLEMCNEGTRLYCDAASNITTGSRFVENERCPDNS